MKKKSSLSVKTLYYLSVFSILILFLLWILQIQFLNFFYERYQIENIKTIAKNIKSEEDLEEGTVEELAYRYDICIQYETETKEEIKVVEINTKNPQCILGQKNKQIENYKADLVKSNQDYIKLFSPVKGIKSIIYKITIGDSSVYLSTTLEDLDTTTSLLRSQLIYITLLLMILSIIMSIFLSRQINKPIIKIIDKAKNLGKGETVIFEESNIEELDELSNVLTVASTEMNKTNELRRDLLANVSHDLKTPLTMIKAYAEKVRDLSYKDDEKRTKDLNVIIQESDRLNNLVNDLVELSKIENGNVELKIDKYDLIDEIEDVMKRYEILQEQDGYKFEIDIPAKAMIKADRNKLDQVLYNLINNAVEHTGDDLKIKISVKQKWDSYIVSITDTGKGINKEDIPLVWNKYYTKNKNHKRNRVGTGIGLSIVKNVLESHGFEYGIDSKVNEYTTFYFKIKKEK
jgi:signal transduction histidine kinase